MYMLETFLKNAKEYIDYLMKVNFRDLFVNTVILLCIIVLSALICIPLGIIEDLIRSFIVVFVDFSGVPALLYYWLFKVIEAGLGIVAFMYLFNKRFEDLNTFKEQVKGNETKKVTLKKNNSKNGEMEELELPKAKSN